MKIQQKREGMGDWAGRPPRADGSAAGWSMPRHWYKDPAVFEQEKSRLFYNSWILAGHVSDLPEVGDYLTFTLLDESVVIVRDKDHTIHGFFNVCRHRGSVLCKETKGHGNRLTCPYHAWTYGLDGNLIAAANMPEDFDPGSIRLKPCTLEVIDGLIFVNFAEEPSSLEGARRDLMEPMAAYDFASLRVAAHKHYDIAANWKVTLENYQECYHCAPSHPEYSESHTLKVEPERFDALQQAMMERMEACGLRHFEVDRQFDKAEPGQEQYAYSRYALFETHKTGSADGEPVAPLLGALTGYDHGASDISIGPFTYFLAYNDHVVAYVFKPTGPETSSCDLFWFVRGDALEGRDYDLGRLTWLWDVTTRADERIITDAQRGINSRAYEPGPLSRMEFLIDRYISWYLSRMIDGEAEA